MKAKLKSFFTLLWSNTMFKKAFHTFWQAFLAVFFVGVPLVVATLKTGGLQTGEHALIALLTAAVAAGLSALKTGFLNIRNSN